MLLLLTLLSLIVQTTPTTFLSAVPAKHDFIKGAIAVIPKPGPSKWIEEAIEKMWIERDAMTVTGFTTITYDSNPNVDIVFKNETTLTAGSQHFRTMWNVFMWTLKNEKIDEKTKLIDGSYGGNSAIAFAYFAKLLGLKALVFVPIDMAPSKLTNITLLGTRIIRAHVSLLARRPREEAIKQKAYFLNSVGMAAVADNDSVPEGHNSRSISFFDEAVEQLTANVSRVDFFVSTINSGSLMNSVARSVAASNSSTKLVAVDSQFSVYYDWAVEQKFENETGIALWRNPGIPEVGMGPQASPVYGNTTSFHSSLVDSVVKLPDISIVAAMWVLKDKDIYGGPAEGANYLTALLIASNDSVAHDITTILTVLSETGSLYEDTFYNRTWVDSAFRRHGGLGGVDCWYRAINNALATGWNPLATGVDSGCPTSWG